MFLHEAIHSTAEVYNASASSTTVPLWNIASLQRLVGVAQSPPTNASDHETTIDVRKTIGSFFAEYWVVMLLALIYYILTVCGILAGAIYEHLGGLNDVIPPGTIKRILLGASTVRGLAASPIIFGIILGTWETSRGLTIGTCIFAFQNGFFWKSTITRMTTVPASSSSKNDL